MTYRYQDADEALKRSVFNKGKVIPDYDNSVWRRDKCGHAIKYSEHGKQGKFGWEIDHVKPVAKGGSDELSNLQPLWWTTNREKGDTYPWNCQ
ncbi:MAG: HNH endonuclease signature motif containing protein [Rhodospirillaceae bacterium]